jgi:hypothetical protein
LSGASGFLRRQTICQYSCGFGLILQKFHKFVLEVPHPPGILGGLQFTFVSPEIQCPASACGRVTYLIEPQEHRSLCWIHQFCKCVGLDRPFHRIVFTGFGFHMIADIPVGRRFSVPSLDQFDIASEFSAFLLLHYSERRESSADFSIIGRSRWRWSWPCKVHASHSWVGVGFLVLSEIPRTFPPLHA